jgi:hypothetical protein
MNMINRKNLVTSALAALAGVSMLALSMSPASALTLPGPALDQVVASSQVDLAHWHGDPGWGRHGDWRWHDHRGYWGRDYWGSSYWGDYPPGPCRIFGGVYQCF